MNSGNSLWTSTKHHIPRSGGGITLDLFHGKRGRGRRRFAAGVFRTARDLQHRPDGHGARVHFRVGGEQVVNGHAKLKRDTADGLALAHGVGKRCRRGKRRLERDQAFGSSVEAEPGRWRSGMGGGPLAGAWRGRLRAQAVKRKRRQKTKDRKRRMGRL
ncbi:MAG: hypothetical protein MZV64_19765 [Ignavibacteriales bacterium]|nr:hypothetical protein [Ignavibacteriales bacterium]